MQESNHIYLHGIHMANITIPRSTITTTFGDLWLYQPLAVDHSRMIDPYWYLVKAQGRPHRSFAGRESLNIWLQCRGLSLTNTLNDQGEYGVQRIKGCYQTVRHASNVSFIDLTDVVKTTQILCSNQYTTARIIIKGGIYQVHYVGPDCKRVIFDYDETHKTIG